MGYMVSPKSTSVKRYDLKLQLTWQCVDARTAPYLTYILYVGYSVFRMPTVHNKEHFDISF
jgi:hypothetical protein